ncbi:MAG TPA: hypothetical protein VJP77_03535, partial [Planctomycetota bacterium]|nr:hypothetical protein [Planctomycetota bacterium]
TMELKLRPLQREMRKNKTKGPHEISNSFCSFTLFQFLCVKLLISSLSDEGGGRPNESKNSNVWEFGIKTAIQ